MKMVLRCSKCGTELESKRYGERDGVICPKCDYWWDVSITLKEFMMFGEEQ